MSLPTGLTLFFAGIVANLPFLNARLFALFRLPRKMAVEGKKPFYMRGFEWLIAYFLAGSVGYALEAHAGQITHQSWEFYVITLCVFGVLAFPGFVWCYLVKRPK